jgi:hypothetical protein
VRPHEHTHCTHREKRRTSCHYYVIQYKSIEAITTLTYTKISIHFMPLILISLASKSHDSHHQYQNLQIKGCKEKVSKQLCFRNQGQWRKVSVYIVSIIYVHSTLCSIRSYLSRSMY